MTHTPEPWKVEPDEDIVAEIDTDVEATQYIIASVDGANPAHKANAARIVSCVNGCAGLTEEEIKDAVSEWKASHANR